jgi:hypothetical protein
MEKKVIGTQGVEKVIYFLVALLLITNINSVRIVESLSKRKNEKVCLYLEAQSFPICLQT